MRVHWIGGSSDLQSQALLDLQNGAANVVSPFSSKFAPAIEKLDVLQDYDISVGTASELLQNFARDME